MLEGAILVLTILAGVAIAIGELIADRNRRRLDRAAEHVYGHHGDGTRKRRTRQPLKVRIRRAFRSYG